MKDIKINIDENISLKKRIIAYSKAIKSAR